MAKIAVILSGCGVFDGAEIHESVIALLALDRAGAQVIVAAPSIPQAHVINHLSGDIQPNEQRHVQVEAARIARGKVVDLAALHAKDIDAIIFPGGFGVAKNFCTYAFDGPAMTIHPDIRRITLEMAQAKKPIGAICIAPVLIAKILADEGFKPVVTIGEDPQTASHIASFGATHQNCGAKDICVDETCHLITTPAYMLASSIREAAQGIEKLVSAVLDRCR